MNTVALSKAWIQLQLHCQSWNTKSCICLSIKKYVPCFFPNRFFFFFFSREDIAFYLNMHRLLSYLQYTLKVGRGTHLLQTRYQIILPCETRNIKTCFSFCYSYFFISLFFSLLKWMLNLRNSDRWSSWLP